MRSAFFNRIISTLVFVCLLGQLSTAYADTKAPEKEDVKTKDANPLVLFKTTAGDIVIELFQKEAPITVANFLKYVDDGFYDGTIFHRVVPGFVVQGGGYTFDFQRKQTREPIKNESDNGMKNLTGTLSMARTSNINSATSQFFINVNNNIPLDYKNKRHGYAVFGKVTTGMKIVKKVEKEPRGLFKAFPEAPNYAVVVEKASRL